MHLLILTSLELISLWSISRGNLWTGSSSQSDELLLSCNTRTQLHMYDIPSDTSLNNDTLTYDKMIFFGNNKDVISYTNSKV